MESLVRPFTIEITDEAIADLRRRLERSRLSNDFANEDGAYGLRAGWLRDMLRYWSDDFDWRHQESMMNDVPQFIVEIDGVAVHFARVKGRGPDSIPIILTHGWPWTFWDWRNVIGPLTDPRAHGMPDAPSFDVIIPSLPGFGFSSPLTRPISCRETAVLWDRLMHEHLEYATYAAAGGDWGSKVTGELGQLFPDRVRGIYLMMLALPGRTAPFTTDGRFAEGEQWMVDRMAQTFPLVSSHLAVHRQDPQTLSYALNDSPAGLAAWIWERRLSWRDPEVPEDPGADPDFLCTTASIYWFTETIGTSMRFYKDNFGDRIAPPLGRITVPTAFGTGPRDLVYMPKAEAELATNLQRWTIFPVGGHFAPNETPVLVAEELGQFFGSL